MRTISTRNASVLASPHAGARCRVSIHDGTSYQDLSTLGGVDWVQSVTVNGSIDSPTFTADVQLLRERFSKSLAPLMQASPINRNFDPTNAYVPLLVQGRKILIEMALFPANTEPVSGDWMTVFEGYIDEFDAGSGASISLSCSDLGAAIRDTFIEQDRVYGFTASSLAGAGLRIWFPSTAYVLNEYMVPNVQESGCYYKCTTAGTSGTSQPTWPTTPTATVTDGTAVWTCMDVTSETGTDVETVMQAIMNDNMASPPTLYTPSSPGWAIKKFQQQRQPVFDAIRALALQIGWDVRYLWRSGTSQFELTFYEPERSKTTPDHTFSASDVLEMRSLKQAISSIRNVVRVVYSDSANLDPDNNPTRTTYETTDATSIATFGRRMMEIQEEQSSAIDTATEAQSMGDAALADLSTPNVDQEVSVRFFPFAELGDLYRFSANGLHYDQDQDLAVVGLSIGFAEGNIRTSLTTRGKPAGAWKEWLRRAVGSPVVHQGPHRLQGLGGSLTLTTSPIVGGTRLDVAEDAKPLQRIWEGYELHVSQTPGFTPDTSTLTAKSSARSFELPHLHPGVEYRMRVVPWGHNSTQLVRGEPSAEVTFTAAQAKTAHLDGLAEWGRIPLNGGFETRFDTSQPPDHWSMLLGTWGTQLDLNTTASEGHGGGQWLELLATASDSEIVSDWFEVDEGKEYRFELWCKVIAAGGASSTITARIEFYQSDQTTQTGTAEVSIDGSGTTGWTKSVGFTNSAGAPVNSRYARFAIIKADGSNPHVGFDSVRIEEYFSWLDPTFQNSWANYGSGYTDAGYTLNPKTGFVHLKGFVKSGTVSTGSTGNIFTLPTGYRPDQNHPFLVLSNGVAAECHVNTDGSVRAWSGSNLSFCLNGIIFRASGYP